MTRSPSARRASKGAQASGGTRASEAPASGCPWSPAPRAPRASRTQATAAKRKNARRRAAAEKPQAPRHVLGRKRVPRMPSAPAAAGGESLATTAPEPPHPKATFPRRPPALGRVPKRLTVCAYPCVCGSESLSLLLPLLRSHPFHLVARNAPEAPAQTGGAGIVLFCLVPKLYK